MRKRITFMVKCQQSRLVLLLLISIFCGFPAFAQQSHSINGVVKSNDDQPLAGVTVRIKGSNMGTTSDSRGQYAIQAKSGDILEFSFIGFESKDVGVGTQVRIDVTLNPAVKVLEEVVTVGYRTVRRGEITGAVSSIGSEELSEIPTTNIKRSLQGRIPGLKIMDHGGPLGSDNLPILVRGASTLGNNAPLIIVDGVPQDNFSEIPSSQIEEITVLKDASAAIYGSRAANGVILVTTKTPKAGKGKIELNSSVGWNSFFQIPKVVSSSQYATWQNEVAERYGSAKPYTDEDIQKYKSGEFPNVYPNTDWHKVAYDDYAPQTDHTLSISGGSDNIKYYVSGNYNYRQSLYKGGEHFRKRYSLRAKIDAKVNRILNLKFDLTGSMGELHLPRMTFDYEVNQSNPTQVGFYTNGLLGPGVAAINQAAIYQSKLGGFISNDTRIIRPQFTMDLNLNDITKGLGLIGTAAFDFSSSNRKVIAYKYDIYNYHPNTDTYTPRAGYGGSRGSVSRNVSFGQQNYYNVRLHYSRGFNGHNISGFVAYEQQNAHSNNFAINRVDPITQSVMELWATSTEQITGSGSTATSGRASYFGSVNYNYKQKYLLDFTLRRDGSYNFAPGHQFGTFPGVSVAWNISKEPFMTSADWIDNLKVRTSWAKEGNDRVAEFQYLMTYALGDFYVFGENPVRYDGLHQNNTPNPIITWEVGKQFDVGFDAVLFNQKLVMNFDYFSQKRRRILITRNESVPIFSGMSLPDENLGKVNNHGFELKLNYVNRLGDFQYTIGGNVQYTMNKIVFMDEPKDVPDYQKKTGHPIQSLVVYKTDGLFHTQGDIDKTSVTLPGTKPGDIKYIDLNGDGKIDGDDRYRRYKGNIPPYQYGINLGLKFKGIKLSAFFQGQVGAEEAVSYGANVSPAKYLFDKRWTPDNPNGSFPRPWQGNDIYNRKLSDFWIYPTNFISLKSLMLAYDITESWSPFEKMQVYVEGYNLWMTSALKRITGGNNFNPEGGGGDDDPFWNAGFYFNQRTIYSVGLNITF